MYKFKEISFLFLLTGMTVTTTFAGRRVELGIDVLRKDNFKILNNRKVALITNVTGVARNGDSTVEILSQQKNFQLKCILTPEHGFRATEEHGKKINDGIDNKTGLPIYSLYGSTTRPTDEMLKDVDVIVFDIQDVGTRFYTYLSTMAQAIEEAGKRHLWFIVLDRPNPLRGDKIEGDILDADIKRLTGYFQMPVRHGLTAGEIATWYVKSHHIIMNLFVIKMKNWERSLWFDQTGLDFIPPSPNIPNLISALLYPGIGCFESTNISVGRGTTTPFEIFGSPWLNAKDLCAYLRMKNFSGVLFEEITFIPTKDIYQNEVCHGIKIILTNRDKVKPLEIFVAAFLYMTKNHPHEFKPEWEEVRVMTGSNKLKEAAEGRLTQEELISQYHISESNFKESIDSYFLYE